MTVLKNPHLYYAIHFEPNHYTLVTVSSRNPSTQSQLIFDFCQLCLEIMNSKHMHKLPYGIMLKGLNKELAEKYKVIIEIQKRHSAKNIAKKFKMVKPEDIIIQPPI